MNYHDIFTDELKNDEPIPEITQGRAGAYSSFSISVDAEGNLMPSSQPASARFGGTGADGPLIITNETVTIDLASAATLIKNYSSISIIGTGALAFINPNSNGTLIIFKSLGNVSLTSSTVPLIDLRSLGGTGGAAGAAGGLAAGKSGAGGASSSASGGNGPAANSGTGPAGTDGNGFGSWINGLVGGGKGADATGTSTPQGGVSPLYTSSSIVYHKSMIVPGSGGGGGQGGQFRSADPSGVGGRGGGALYIECLGTLTFTGTINGAGAAGGSDTGANPGSGAGGGGGAGSVVILYNNIVTNTGTVTVTGGAAGTTTNGVGPAGAGAAGLSAIQRNVNYI